MSTIDTFNRIDDCDKIDPLCIDAFSDLTLDDDGILCSITSWGKSCIDLAKAVKDFESCTTLYLSPEDDPNCLVYEKEENCGENDCIHGDDLSRIISMRYLKDVTQEVRPSDGIVYMFNGDTNLFEPYDLKTTIQNINTRLQNIEQTLANHESRLQLIEEILTKPEGAPDGVRVCWGTINTYSDPNVVISEGSGAITSLDKDHGLYTHGLSANAYGDQVFG